MKLRCVFVTDAKLSKVPKGWDIYRVDLVSPPKGRPQFMVLLKQQEDDKNKVSQQIGFKIDARSKSRTKAKRQL